MRRTLPAAALAALTLAACQDAATPTTAAVDTEISQSGAPVYIVTYKSGVNVDVATDELARETGMAVLARRHHAARGFTAAIPMERLSRILRDPRVEIVERDHIVTLDLPRETAKPGGGGGGAQSTPWGITRVGGAGDGTGKTAWIIDSGIDLNHADLNTSRNCHAYFTGTSPADGNGHGTHVAGTVAAKNNGQDVVGVAANAYVCAVRVLGNSGSGSYSGIIAGVNYVAANGASGDVANMSLGGSGSNATLEQAVVDAASLKGIRFVLAAGNNGTHASNFTPARVNGNNVYTISATDSRDCMASFSNYGNPPVDFAAPGVSIVSTRKGGGTTTMSGTSMAAPHVAGILLLGGARASGSASCDPDGSPDPIASR